MPVTLEGSCHCGTVKYTVDSSTAVPYQLCVCSICRKVGGVGGSINLGADARTLKILQGKDAIRVYNAVMNHQTGETASSERNFCSKCSAMLWLFDKEWPELLHPFASSIDAPALDPPDVITVVKTVDKPGYVRLPEGEKQVNKNYGDLSIDEWHKKHGKYVK